MHHSVHPHLRGAYLSGKHVGGDAAGSSPPTWGIPRSICSSSGSLRFIPTYVGHTVHCSFAHGFISVHPHLRGAYVKSTREWLEDLGSSPPTWGIRLCFSGSNRDIWFIPTYVGHTLWRSGRKPNSTVHPHLRGAYDSTSGKFTSISGSSPPTWGIHGVDAFGVVLVRFIPTYVGHTLSRLYHPDWFTVHPHLRGAYRNALSAPLDENGSSPPTWGILNGP